MGLYKIILLFLLCSFQNEHILFLSHEDHIEKALAQYQEYVVKEKHQDYELLQSIALDLLKRGAKSQDSEILKLTMLGAGISLSTSSLEILERGILSQDPQIQLIALNQLAPFQDDKTSELLLKAMSSDSLLSRIEAAYQLSSKKHPQAFGQIESLMNRLPPPIRPLFPYFFALLGTPEAIDTLKNLIHDPIVEVRVEAITNAARFQRDDLLPTIRTKIFSSSPSEKEAAIFALGEFKDISSIKLLETAALSTESVQIATFLALKKLNNKKDPSSIIKLATQENLFAINALSEIEDQSVLLDLLKSKKSDVRINAALALLKCTNRACLPVIKEILVNGEKDFIFKPQFSVGRTLFAWKVLSSASQRTLQEEDIAISYSLREEVLKKAALLPEEDFLEIARYIFETCQNDLVPTLVNLLGNLRNEKSISLLKEFSQKLGAPLIRDYCSLSLFKLKEPTYEDYVLNWLTSNSSADLIQLKKLLPRGTLPTMGFDLTAEETSRLLIDMYAALADRRDEKSINALVEAIKKSCSKNRYALVGLLLRSTQ